MARVTGIGGVFFKARDPDVLIGWYRDVLGLAIEPHGAVTFAWTDDPQPGGSGHTVWAPFPEDTTYFAPSDKPYMFNFRVDDLDGVLHRLRAASAQVDDRTETYPYGRFGWAMDPEGNRIEFWEPAADAPS
jgi:predicted enzyme related to lactoylglutathione lyase